MIGGTVIETIELEDRVWINTKEKNSTSTCAIYVKKMQGRGLFPKAIRFGGKANGRCGLQLEPEKYHASTDTITHAKVRERITTFNLRELVSLGWHDPARVYETKSEYMGEYFPQRAQARI